MSYERTRVVLKIKGDRVSFRKNLVNTFIDERPGTGIGIDTTRYIYEADNSPSGHTIELWRPAMLNKGIDFTIRIPSLTISGRRLPWSSVPSHDDLKRILTKLRDSDSKAYEKIEHELSAAYHCKKIKNLIGLKDIYAAPIEQGCDRVPADVVVLIAKWLFVEQDLTYWNQSGRNMLGKMLQAEGLIRNAS